MSDLAIVVLVALVVVVVVVFLLLQAPIGLRLWSGYVYVRFCATAWSRCYGCQKIQPASLISKEKSAIVLVKDHRLCQLHRPSSLFSVRFW